MIVAASILPLLVVTCWLGYSDYVGLRQATFSQLSDVSRALVQVLDRELVARSGTIEVLGEDPGLRAGDLRGFEARARAALPSLPPGSSIVLADHTGQELVNSSRAAGEPLPQISNVEAVNRLVKSDIVRETWVSDLFIGASSQRPLVAVYATVRTDRNETYVLAIGWPANSLAAILATQHLPADSVGAIIDRNGTVIARTRDADSWVGAKVPGLLGAAITDRDEGTIENRTLDNVDVVTAWTRSAPSGWTVAIGESSASLTSTLLRNYLFIATAGLVAMLSGLSIVALVAGRLIKSISALRARAAAVGTGRETPFVSSTIAEIDAVHRALTLAARLIAERAKQRDSAEEQQRLLMAEIDHRVKNILANVQAIASLSLPSTPQTKSFSERLSALARVHNLLAQSRWRGTSLKTLVESTLAAYGGTAGQQVMIHGEDALLRPSSAQALSLILNELVTNSSKYGALSDPSGRLSVEFMHDVRSTEVVLHWIEWNSKPIPKPAATGFGSSLIDRLVRELPGTVERVYHDSGLECRILMSLSDYALPAAPPPTLPPHHASRTVEANTRILVVEDSTLAGLELCDIISEAGFTAIGPATSVTRAMTMLDEGELAVGVLDVNMNGEMVFPVAEAMQERNIPFIFVTGYGDDYVWPSQLRSAPRLRKPVQAFQLLDAISAAIVNTVLTRTASPSLE
jgi:two-component sensor histidine kinase